MRPSALFLVFLMLLAVVTSASHTKQHLQGAVKVYDEPNAETFVYMPKNNNGQERPVVVEVAQVPEQKFGAQRQSFKSFFQRLAEVSRMAFKSLEKSEKDFWGFAVFVRMMNK
ncbi:hypothetical protein Ae201684P_005001 [Aphanomyces euteiches]|uniref:RxLR effector protein n=1 Tax=Aphanomyces euteiches TaxID=100861 RepID=A0A6G0W9Z1_9STRA|nr:hypothetical protein Ae201684_017454 [Aphanomyces euteiches]KAH9085291.1 hypothetical protein Ae201684P_005001 [Aphanomyces euteiches]